MAFVLLRAAFDLVTALALAPAAFEGVREAVGTSALRTLALVLGGVHWALLGLAATAYLAWLYRAAYNARELALPGLRYEPSEAVVSWFLPFVSLLRPYQVLRNLDAVLEPSSLPAEPSAEPAPAGYRTPALRTAATPVSQGEFLAWWGLYLLNEVTGRGHFSLPEGSPYAAHAALANVLSAAVGLLAGILCARIVARVTLRAEQVCARSDAAHGPPVSR